MFPFSAIVGQEDAKLALMLVAVSPDIGGVLLSGVKGTGKSTLIRAFPSILPDVEVVAGCPYNCSPRNPEEMCTNCRAKFEAGEELPIAKVPAKVVTVPLGTTEDRLLGTIDVETLLKTGEVKFEKGLLASANRQVLYIDEVNLLPDNITDDILDSAASGVNTVEREGISITHPAKFSLIGTMNPEEGQLRPQILDRFALSVKIDTIKSPKMRLEIVNRALAYSSATEKFERTFGRADEKLKERISLSRNRLPDVKIPRWAIDSVATAMAVLGVDGQRPDIVTIKSAIAYAALEGDDRVEKRHIEKVAPLAVCHRTRNGGFDPPPTKDEVLKTLSNAIDKAKKEGTATDMMMMRELAEFLIEKAMQAIEKTAEDIKKNR